MAETLAALFVQMQGESRAGDDGTMRQLRKCGRYFHSAPVAFEPTGPRVSLAENREAPLIERDDFGQDLGADSEAIAVGWIEVEYHWKCRPFAVTGCG
jgi:hypothetical protein